MSSFESLSKLSFSSVQFLNEITFPSVTAMPERSLMLSVVAGFGFSSSGLWLSRKAKIQYPAASNSRTASNAEVSYSFRLRSFARFCSALRLGIESFWCISKVLKAFGPKYGGLPVSA